MKNERQIHGFIYEQEVVKRFNLRKQSEYTAVWDAYTQDGIPVSIKTEKVRTDIELGDYFRNARNEQDFYLVVGFWEKDKTNIIEEKILFIPGVIWRSLFVKSFEEKLHKLLREITNSPTDDKKWKELIAHFRNEWKQETDNLIRLRFKRDHKKQKRIQCAINNKDFFNYFCKNFEIE